MVQRSGSRPETTSSIAEKPPRGAAPARPNFVQSCVIATRSGSIFDLPAQAIVNPVNCVGVMGNGLALEFSKRFPAHLVAYQAACRDGSMRPGRVLVTSSGMLWPSTIIAVPTKRHWRDASRLDDVRAGIVDLARVVVENDIETISIPMLGCGLGGLDWADVRPLLVEAFEGLAVTAYLFEAR